MLDGIITVITDFASQIGSIQLGITGILGAIVAISLLFMLFNRFGK